jgi:hypothetical protein
VRGRIESIESAKDKIISKLKRQVREKYLTKPDSFNDSDYSKIEGVGQSDESEGFI